MTKIILADGKTLSPLSIFGEQKLFEGHKRDILSFYFPKEQSLDELDSIFSPASCENITIEEGGKSHLYHAYTLRVSLERVPVKTQEETPDSPAVYEDRVKISIAQRTYLESSADSFSKKSEELSLKDSELEKENALLKQQVKALTEQNDFQEELIVEMANVLYA